MAARQVNEPFGLWQYTTPCSALDDSLRLTERGVAELLRELLIPLQPPLLAEQPQSQSRVIPWCRLRNPEQTGYPAGEAEANESGILQLLRGPADMELCPKLLDFKAGDGLEKVIGMGADVADG
jgi:hypothetical protein